MFTHLSYQPRNSASYPTQFVKVMGLRKYNKAEPLKYVVSIRLPESFYIKLEGQRQHSNCQTLGEFARNILQEKKVIWYYKDATMDGVALELAAIKTELRAIGTNINQITRSFNNSTIQSQKILESLKVLEEYKKVSAKVDLIHSIISNLKWSPR